MIFEITTTGAPRQGCFSLWLLCQSSHHAFPKIEKKLKSYPFWSMFLEKHESKQNLKISNMYVAKKSSTIRKRQTKILIFSQQCIKSAKHFLYHHSCSYFSIPHAVFQRVNHTHNLLINNKNHESFRRWKPGKKLHSKLLVAMVSIEISISSFKSTKILWNFVSGV